VLRIRSWIYYVFAGGLALAAIPIMAAPDMAELPAILASRSTTTTNDAVPQRGSLALDCMASREQLDCNGKPRAKSKRMRKALVDRGERDGTTVLLSIR